jgi:GntR family transcriptional repressor for pyruvate dehydrogenase complex
MDEGTRQASAKDRQTPAGRLPLPAVSLDASATQSLAMRSRADDKFQVVKTRRTFEEVTSQVRDLLFKGSLKTGDRLPPERELSALLGIGRPALREALRALEVSGLVELRKGKMGGAFIAGSSPRVVADGMSDMLRLGNVSVEELFEAREWFLSALVRPVCRRITAVEIAELLDNVDRAESLHASGQFRERIEENFVFYGLLAKASRNPVAMMVVDSLTWTLRALIDRVGSDLAPLFFSHRRDLIAALKSRNEELAASVMARIVKMTERTYKRLLEKTARDDGQRPVDAKPKAPRHVTTSRSAEGSARLTSKSGGSR